LLHRHEAVITALFIAAPLQRALPRPGHIAFAKVPQFQRRDKDSGSPEVRLRGSLPAWRS
jgi:hypothetical protein